MATGVGSTVVFGRRQHLKEENMNRNRRAHERYERRLHVVLVHEGGEIDCVTRNVSLGGMLLATSASLRFGTRVRLRVRLPALKADTDIEATVRWSGDDSLGVQFGSLRAIEVWALNQLFKEGDGSLD